MRTQSDSECNRLVEQLLGMFKICIHRILFELCLVKKKEERNKKKEEEEEETR